MSPITESGQPKFPGSNQGRRRLKQTPNLSPKISAIDPGDRRRVAKQTPNVSPKTPVSPQIKTHPTHPTRPQEPELEKVCAEFASIFSYVLIKSMRSTIPESSFLQEFQGKKLVEAMADQKMAQYLSFQNGFGIKEMLLKTLINNRQY
jgi:flagellar protein FlgJ